MGAGVTVAGVFAGLTPAPGTAVEYAGVAASRETKAVAFANALGGSSAPYIRGRQVFHAGSNADSSAGSENMGLYFGSEDCHSLKLIAVPDPFSNWG